MFKIKHYYNNHYLKAYSLQIILYITFILSANITMLSVLDVMYFYKIVSLITLTFQFTYLIFDCVQMKFI